MSSWFDASAAGALAQHAEYALSPDAAVRKPAEAFLKSNEGKRGYAVSCLAVACGQAHSSSAVRVLAAICLKNCIQRHWRERRRGPAVVATAQNGGAAAAPSPSSGVPRDEKEVLRARILQCLAEPDDAVAAQLAVIVGKIARLDWPQEFPGLIETLVQSIESADVLVERRGTAVMYAVLKELSSRRLLADRRQMEQLAKQLLGGMYAVWKEKARRAIESLQRGPTGAAPALVELLYKTSKVLRLLFVHGSPNLDSQDSFGGVFGEVFDLVEFLVRAGNGGDPAGTIPKCVKCLIKIVVDTQKGRAMPFLPYLSLSLQKFAAYVKGYRHAMRLQSSDASSAAAAGTHSHEKLAILSMHFLVNVLQCKAYKQKGDAQAQKLMTARGDVVVGAKKRTRRAKPWRRFLMKLARRPFSNR